MKWYVVSVAPLGSRLAYSILPKYTMEDADAAGALTVLAMARADLGPRSWLTLVRAEGPAVLETPHRWVRGSVGPIPEDRVVFLDGMKHSVSTVFQALEPGQSLMVQTSRGGESLRIGVESPGVGTYLGKTYFRHRVSAEQYLALLGLESKLLADFAGEVSVEKGINAILYLSGNTELAEQDTGSPEVSFMACCTPMQQACINAYAALVPHLEVGRKLWDDILFGEGDLL